MDTPRDRLFDAMLQNRAVAVPVGHVQCTYFMRGDCPCIGADDIRDNTVVVAHDKWTALLANFRGNEDGQLGFIEYTENILARIRDEITRRTYIGPEAKVYIFYPVTRNRRALLPEQVHLIHARLKRLFRRVKLRPYGERILPQEDELPGEGTILLDGSLQPPALYLNDEDQRSYSGANLPRLTSPNLLTGYTLDALPGWRDCEIAGR